MTDRAKTIRYASDDHADDLLADILESTEDQAQAEQAELDNSMASRRAAEERAKAEAHAERLAERQKKLQRELARQEELAKRRTLRMKALSVPEDAPDEEEAAPVEVTPSLDEAAIRRQIAEEVRDELRAIGMTPMPAPVTGPPPTKSRNGLFAAAAAILIAAGLGVAGFTAQSAYKPDPNPYSKAVFAPMDRNAVALEMGSVPIPKAAPIEQAATQEPPPSVKRPRPAAARPTPKEHRDTSIFGKPKKTTEERDSYLKLKDLLDSSNDPFSAGD